MIERVRALLITPARGLLLIKRTRPGIPVYWVFPGGHVEPTDADRHAALTREIHEEIAGTPSNIRPFHTLDNGSEIENFYLADITAWSFDDRTGPEFSQDGRGEYALEEVPLTVEALAAIDLKPGEIAERLCDAITSGEIAALRPVAS